MCRLCLKWRSWRAWLAARVEDLRGFVCEDLVRGPDARTWDTHQIFRLSQFPRRVHQHNARRFPDTTFPQPLKWPGTAIFERVVDNKSLDRTPARRDR